MIGSAPGRHKSFSNKTSSSVRSIRILSVIGRSICDVGREYLRLDEKFCGTGGYCFAGLEDDYRGPVIGYRGYHSVAGKEWVVRGEFCNGLEANDDYNTHCNRRNRATLHSYQM